MITNVIPLKNTTYKTMLVQTASGPMEESPMDEPGEDWVPWDCLPYNVLVCLLSYLQDVDRRSVALVCRTWYSATRDPSLWRDKQFFLYSSHQIPRNINWLQSHAHHVHHATVMCFGTLDKSREDFIDQLEKTDLRSLEMNGCAYWWSISQRADDNQILAKVTDLIRSQTSLRFFQMRQASMSFKAGIDILSILAQTSCSTITRLGLEDFFYEESDVYRPSTAQTNELTRCLSAFPLLSELTSNFQYITEPLLQWFCTKRRRMSVTLKLISWQRNFGPTKYISAEAWDSFANACRPARVCLTLQNIKNIKDVTALVLLRTVPLIRLNLLGVTAVNERDVNALIGLLNHVELSYNKSIVGFKLWGNNKLCDGMEVALIRLLTRCQSLIDLDLHMDLQPAFMGRVCRLQQKGKVRLRSFRMARSLSHTAEFDEFRRCIQHWYPLFKNLNLDFQIRVESSPIHSAFRSYSFLVADNRGIIDHVDGRNQMGSWASSYSTDSNNNDDGGGGGFNDDSNSEDGDGGLSGNNNCNLNSNNNSNDYVLNVVMFMEPMVTQMVNLPCYNCNGSDFDNNWSYGHTIDVGNKNRQVGCP